MKYNPRSAQWKTLAITTGTLAAVAGSLAFLNTNFTFSTVGRSLAAQSNSVCDSYQYEYRSLSAELAGQKAKDTEAAARLREEATRLESKVRDSRAILLDYDERRSRIDSAEFEQQIAKFKSREAPHILSAAREAVFEENSLRLERRSERFLVLWWKAGLNQYPAGQLLGLNFQDESSFTLGMQKISKLSEDSLTELIRDNGGKARTRARERISRALEDGAFRAQSWDQWQVRFNATGCANNPICHSTPPPPDALRVAETYRRAEQLAQDGSPETNDLKMRLEQLRRGLEKAESNRIRHGQDPGSCGAPNLENS